MSTFAPLPPYGRGIVALIDLIGDPFSGVRPGAVFSRRKSLEALSERAHEAWRAAR